VEVEIFHPELIEEPMTDDRMALVELLQKSGDSDFQRAVAEAVLQILMGNEAPPVSGSGKAKAVAQRVISSE